MFKKLLVATAAMLLSATSVAGISLSGLYEGTLDSHGAYTQDITTTMKGTSGNSSVTVVLDESFDVDYMYVETVTSGLTLKLGDWSGDDPDSTKLSISATAAGMTIGMSQVSGGSTEINASGSLAGMTVGVTNLTSSERETTATGTWGGVTVKAVHNTVTAGTNLETTVSTTMGGLTLSGTHDSNADGTSKNEGSVSRALEGLGTVKLSASKTGAGVKETGVSLTRGIWTADWTKTGSADGVTTLKASLAF